MADNEETGTAKKIATLKGTHSGDADQNLQLVVPGYATGAEGSRTLAAHDATTPLPVSPAPLDSAIDSIDAKGAAIGVVTETAPASDTASSGLNGRLQRIAQRITSLIALLPSSIGQKNSAGSLSVTLSSDHGSLPASPLPTLASTGTITSVNDTATSATLLSSSATRKGFRIFNDSTQVLYIKYGTTASATDFSDRLLPGEKLEENHYYGRVDGIWAADASGAARITDLQP